MTWLDSIIKEAGKGSEETEKKMTETETVSKELTAEEQAAAKNILDMLNNNQKHDEDIVRKNQERIFESDVPVDINGHDNHTNEAVFYQPHTSYTKWVPGIPYAVSDVNWICNQCTNKKICERHRERKPQKTDISLCSESHVRMALFWDISDPENRKKTWRFEIEEKYDRFNDPDQVRSEHEFAKKRNGGCKPHEPAHRVKELAVRIVQDYNEDRKDKARVANLDSKGREYYTKPRRWGGKDPFKPSEVASVRAAHEYQPADGSRIEAELRVLLQAWYQSKLPKSERGIDRTTANANKTWREKMELQAAQKAAQLSGSKLEYKEKMADSLLKGMKMNADQMKRFEMSSRAKRDATMKARADRIAYFKEQNRLYTATKRREAAARKKEEKRRAAFDYSSESESEKGGQEQITDGKLAMFEQMGKEVEDEAKGVKKKTKQVEPVVKSKVSKAAREPTTEERELLQKIKDAEAEDIQDEESFESEPEPQPKVEEEQEEDAKPKTPKSTTPEPKSNRRKASTSLSPSTAAPKKPKTTSSPSPPKAAAKKPKSAKAPGKPPVKPKPKAATPASSSTPAKKSRKAYKSSDIIDDSDDEADYALPSAPALELSEQREGWKLPGDIGDSVKVVQTDKKTKSAKKADSEKANVDVVVEQGTTIITEIAREDTPQAELHPLAAAASSSPSKKRKNVSWSEDLVEQPGKKRKLSQCYAQGAAGEQGELGDEHEHDDLFDE